MAEINIEKKTPKWPWILLILVIIGILIYMFASNDDGEKPREMADGTTAEAADTGQVAPNNPTVTAFVSFIKEDPDPMGLDHEFTSEALSRLTNASSATADEIGYDIQKDIDQVKTLSEKITRDPFETTHANSIKEAAGILAGVLQNMQQSAFPGLESEADEVENAVTAIETDVLTLEQKEEVKNFFRESADLLEKMNSSTPNK